MTMKTTLAVAALLGCLALPAVVQAQAQLKKATVSAGGGTTSSANHTVRMTIGQPAVGHTSDGGYDLAVGFWFGGLGGPTAVGDDIPSVFGMDQNFPNPFNPMTVISFALPDAMPVRLSIFNVRGERVRVLVDETREAGRHDAVWDGADDQGKGVASGTYIARIESKAGILNRKMLLAR